MKVRISNISVDEHAINPTLTFDLDIEFYELSEAPVSIGGYLRAADDKVLSHLSETRLPGVDSYEFKMQPERNKDIKIKENRISLFSPRVEAILTPIAIEHIEAQRENEKSKSVRLNLDIACKYLEMTGKNQFQPNSDFMTMQVRQIRINEIIKQSDWIQKFAPKLGIGNFLLLELEIPNQKNVPEFWNQFYSKLSKNVDEMNKFLRSGEWHSTMNTARRFSENIKALSIQKEWKKLLKNDLHSEEGIKNLSDAIQNFFDFTSKYYHEINHQGNHQSIPNSNKEDAYFAYSLSVGLLNLIGRKLARNN